MAQRFDAPFEPDNLIDEGLYFGGRHELAFGPQLQDEGLKGGHALTPFEIGFSQSGHTPHARRPSVRVISAETPCLQRPQ